MPIISNETLPLTVDNTGFLLDRLGTDCHPLQFLRELTQNSIEAILHTSEKRARLSGTLTGRHTNWASIWRSSCASPTTAAA